MDDDTNFESGLAREAQVIGKAFSLDVLKTMFLEKMSVLSKRLGGDHPWQGGQASSNLLRKTKREESWILFLLELQHLS